MAYKIALLLQRTRKMSSIYNGKLYIGTFLLETVSFCIFNNSINNYSLWIFVQKFEKSARNIILISVVL